MNEMNEKQQPTNTNEIKPKKIVNKTYKTMAQKDFKMGTDLMLFKDGTPLAFAKSCKFQIQLNTLDVSSKDSGYWTEKLSGKLSFNLSSENLYTIEDYEALVDAMINRQPISVQWSSAAGTAPNWTPNQDGYKGNAYITSIESNASDGEVATYSVSLDGTGKLDKVVPGA